MRTDDLLKSRWLSGADVEPFMNATVHSITEEEVGRDKEVKTIVWFTEFDKGLVCNRTNIKNLINLLGKGDTDNWKGKQVQLYATTQEFGGEEYNVVRVRAVQPAGGKPAAPAPAASAQPGPRELLDAFTAKNSLTPEALAEKVKQVLGTVTIGAWVNAEPGRTVAGALKLMQDQLELDNLGM